MSSSIANPVQVTLEELTVGRNYLILYKGPRGGGGIYGTLTSIHDDVVFDESHDPDGYGTYYQIDNRVSIDAGLIFSAYENRIEEI